MTYVGIRPQLSSQLLVRFACDPSMTTLYDIDASYCPSREQSDCGWRCMDNKHICKGQM